MPVLLDLGHDGVRSGSWESDPGDPFILAHAHSTRRILVTMDKDFGELVILKEMPHHGIIRLTGFRANPMAWAIHPIIGRDQQELENGAMIPADPERIRTP